jgi:hypothetical protein
VRICGCADCEEDYEEEGLEIEEGSLLGMLVEMYENCRRSGWGEGYHFGVRGEMSIVIGV